ncbi:MAG TPA: protein kinase [Actinocatenispora sp.]
MTPRTGVWPPARVAALARRLGMRLGDLHAAGRCAGAVHPDLLHPTADGVDLAPGEPDPACTAPEVLAGGSPTPASDAYAFAATCHALLTGTPPYGTGDAAVLRALTEPPPDLTGFGAEAADLVRRTLSREPADRLPVAEFGTRLAAALTDAAPTGERPPREQPSAAPTLPPDASRQETLPPGAEEPGGVPLGSRYLLYERLGSGATGVVRRARRRDDGRLVAVKVLRAEYARDPDVTTRFLRERNLLRSLTHPNLVRVHDLVAEGDTLAVVMEYVPGHDLRHAVRPPVAAALDLLARVCAGLAAVHAAGVVHRDVKPENILLTRDGTVAKLADFGLARAVYADDLTRDAQLLGTPAYLAPELAAGGRPGPAADVYAVGVTAYELLAGHRPFRADNAMALLRAHLDDVPARPPGLPDAVWRMLAACLAKKPADRPTAADLAGRLAALAAAESAPSLGTPPRPAAGATGPSPAHPGGIGPSVSHPSGPAGPGGRSGQSGPGGPGGQSRASSPNRPSGETASSGVSGPGDPSGLRSVGAAPDRSAGPAGVGADGNAGLRSGATGSGAGTWSGSGVGAVPTAGATRPLPDTPTTPTVRRRRWPLPVALAVCAVIGGGAGIWWGTRTPTHQRPAPRRSASGAPRTQAYPLPVVATSTRRGEVTLSFPDSSGQHGFSSYLVLRDDTVLGQVDADQAPPYTVSGLDPGTRYCYQVSALIASTRTPDPVQPTCVTADGKHS